MKNKMDTGPRLAAGLLTLTLTIALAGCGTPNEGDAGARGSGDTPVTDSPGGNPGTGGGPEVVSPTPGTAGAEPVEWDKVRLDKDGRSLWVRWWSGVEPCYVLDRVEVQVDHRVVMITLWEGHDPDRKEVACPEMAVLKETKVSLSQPLDDRGVFDGARLEAMRDPKKCKPDLPSIVKCPLVLHPNPRVQRPR